MGRLRDLMHRSPHVGEVRGRGLMMGVELVEERSAYRPARELAERVYYRCLEQGLSFKISAGNVLTLSPPLIIGRADLDRALDIVEAAVLAG
jgi:4-aminobutyrate aminotransferase